MAKKRKTAKALVKYGPLMYAAAQRYGPTVWAQVQTHREPIEKMAQNAVAKGNQRKKALAHAKTLNEGNVLQVFHANQEHWVVFTNDRPVAVHPPSEGTYADLLKDVDLSRRIYPSTAPVTVRIRKPYPRPKPTPAPPRAAERSLEVGRDSTVGFDRPGTAGGS